MTALTAEELLTWLDQTSNGWRSLVQQHPEILAFPCSTRETHNVAELLQHIVAVELRYAERLCDLPETPYDGIPCDTAHAIFATHARAMDLLRPLLQQNAEFWDASIHFMTRSAGQVSAPRRAILVHLAMHAIRHYAQLATLVREHGIAPGWQMDYLFAVAQQV